MCFRPADVSQPVQCPNCGKDINSVAGVYPSNCPFCSTELVEITPDAATPPLGAPAAPGAPGAPKAPGAPGASKAPTAPKA